MTQHVGHHESDVIAQLHRKIATLERERDEALEALRKLEKTATAVLLHKMERERDEALEALRPFAAVYDANIEDERSLHMTAPASDLTHGNLRVARAILAKHGSQ